MSCDHNCLHCKGCSVRDLSMTEEEIKVLSYFAEIPFLPVARKTDSEMPCFFEKQDYSLDLYGSILLCLEKKRLISIDYDKPIPGWGSGDQKEYPIIGSMALTNRGQSVLDILSVSGIQ